VLVPPATAHTTLAASPLRSITRRNPPASGCAVPFHCITRRTVGMARGATRGTSLHYTSLLPSRLRHTEAVARSTRKHSPKPMQASFMAMPQRISPHSVPISSRYTFPSMSYKFDMAGNKCRLVL
jgi:hypothetical protein